MITLSGQYKRAMLALCGVLCFLFVCTPGLQAQSTAAISQGFQTRETNVTAGALVSLVPNDKGTVQLTHTDRAQQLVGVIGDKPLVSLSGNTTELQVVISGMTPAIVSNINGDIKIGDKITASPIEGVGMKATSSTQIVGTAQENFSNTQTREVTVKDREGQPRKVLAGTLPIQVNVTSYTVPEERDRVAIPAFLQQIANSVAGKDVSVTRVLIALLILLAGSISVGILLYSSVQSSIISIGRNPLSEGAVDKSLMQVGFASLGILLVMVIAIYLVLTL